MRVFASLMSIADFLEEYPRVIPAEKFIAAGNEDMPSDGFWGRFHEAVSPDQKVFFFGQEVAILAWGRETRALGFSHHLGICLIKGEPTGGLLLTPVGEIGEEDLEFTISSQVIDIRRKIHKKVSEAYIKLEEKRKEIEGLMKILDITSGFMIGNWLWEDRE